MMKISLLSSTFIQRTIKCEKNHLYTNNFSINNINLINSSQSNNNKEIVFDIYLAEPDERPKGLDPNDSGIISQSNKDQDGTDGLKITNSKNNKDIQEIRWNFIKNISSLSWQDNIDSISSEIIKNTKSKTLKIEFIFNNTNKILSGLHITLFYQIYKHESAITKKTLNG